MTPRQRAGNATPVGRAWPAGPHSRYDALVRLRGRSRTLVLVSALLHAAASIARGPAPAPEDRSAVAELQREARSLEPLAGSALGRRFLAGTAQLRHVAPRTVFHDSARTRYWSATEAAALPATTRDSLLARTIDEGFYYTTRYGSPLAYLRSLDLLAAAGLDDLAGKKIVDFGYGTIGHLRLLAGLGAEVVGIEVDPLLRALYSEPGDQGRVGDGAAPGSLRLIHGHFPAGAGVLAGVGSGVDLFISKNTLKNGYIHPAEPVDPRRLVHLGVSDSAYVAALYAILKPGGRVMIYNLCPAPAPPGKPYIPWADGRCPFPVAMWKRAGFLVTYFDRDDTEAARRMGHALGWDQGPGAMNLETDLFATYTLVTKPKWADRSDPR